MKPKPESSGKNPVKPTERIKPALKLARDKKKNQSNRGLFAKTVNIATALSVIGRLTVDQILKVVIQIIMILRRKMTTKRRSTNTNILIIPMLFGFALGAILLQNNGTHWLDDGKPMETDNPILKPIMDTPPQPHHAKEEKLLTPNEIYTKPTCRLDRST
jgi:hypothetical protein